MRNLVSKVLDLPVKIAAMVTVASLVAEQAHAASTSGGVGDLADRVSGQFQQVGSFVIIGSFLVGFGLSAAGLMKLKQAADSGGQQVKYSEGLWRLGVGAGLVALPAVTNTGFNTFWSDNAAATVGSATFSSGGGGGGAAP